MTRGEGSLRPLTYPREQGGVETREEEGRGDRGRSKEESFQDVHHRRAQPTCEPGPHHQDSPQDGGRRILPLAKLSTGTAAARPWGTDARPRHSSLRTLSSGSTVAARSGTGVKAELKRRRGAPCSCGGHRTDACQPFKLHELNAPMKNM